MRTFRDAKTMAKTLRTELGARRGVELTHGECLEIVARQFGFDDWNVLAAKTAELATIDGDGSAGAWGARTSTIPVLRVFSVEKAREFYVDFLGFVLDFGGPSSGGDSPFYGQVSRGRTTLQLTEAEYDPYPGATVFIWLDGVHDLHRELNERRQTVKVWGPAVWTPAPEETPFGTVMTIADPFGNALRFTEPTDPKERAALPRWSPAVG
ncbi:glyoxalase superfamily protein [Jiangella anatolica]|uniref:Bleomycin resistance protein n=1 Tax=Jiangella anatolica TaxID=2670374 RepID=A0A2W2BZ52_9ACTN|nr:glyoxalase superfamily protein [Jiangella anatolica]PZF85724.1 VOC family protein [Jiangella anatolica]